MYNERSLKKVTALLQVFSKKDRRYRSRIRTWEDFQKLPILTREDMSAFSGSVVPLEAFNITATSGSTASRLIIAHSLQAHEVHLRRLVKIYRYVGARQGMLCLNLCSYELNSGGRLMESAYKGTGCGVIPLGPISTPEKVSEAVRLIKLLKPVIVNAYTNQLFDLFSVLGRKHSIRTCVVNGEPLWPAYRQRIEQMGGVRVYDHYGAMEVSGFAIALQPDDEWMRVVADGLLLEVSQEKGAASTVGTGDLLVTDLNNTCMPFIRYRLGDKVELIRRKNALWVKVLARTEDSVLINGVVVIKRTLVQTAGDLLEHPGFFFIFTKDPIRFCDRMIINVVGSKNIRSQDLVKSIIAATGMDNCIDVRPYKGAIPRTHNGKISYFIDTRKAA